MGYSPSVDGTSNGPVKTLTRALELARNYTTDTLKKISVAAGYYTLSQTVFLTDQDSNLEIIAEVIYPFYQTDHLIHSF